MNDDILNRVMNINGFLSANEASLLYDMASKVSAGGRIVEIGSYQGRSTVCLGLGAKQAGAQVWAIDPHEDCQVDDRTHYGMENHAALLRNLTEHDLGATVRVVAVPSLDAVIGWFADLDLVFIDGNHDYQSFRNDLVEWSLLVKADGKLLVHDTSGHFPSVTQALDEFLAYGYWKRVDQIDATAFLERA